jgi:hypothetical protein
VPPGRRPHPPRRREGRQNGPILTRFQQARRRGDPPDPRPRRAAGRTGPKGVEALDPGDVVTADDLRSAANVKASRSSRGASRSCTPELPLLGRDRALPRRAGMDAGASYWLADRGVSAVGADNMAWDAPGLVDPELDARCRGT